MSDDPNEPRSSREVLTVSDPTYQEIRQLLLKSHNAGRFERHDSGMEMMNLFNVGLIKQAPAPKPVTGKSKDRML